MKQEPAPAISSSAKRRDSPVTALRERRAREACRYLASVDRKLRVLIDRIGPHRLIITRDPFVALIGSIIQQQISMSAAAAIQKRVRGLCPRGRVTASGIRALSPHRLRGAGLSRAKVQYILNLAEHFATRRLTAPALRRMPDDEVIAATTAVKGIGRWTAEMLLLFCLERPDVWPVDDLGLRKAVRLFIGSDEMPGADTLQDLAEPWRPHRSYATWYLWRSLEGPLMPGIALSAS